MRVFIKYKSVDYAGGGNILWWIYKSHEIHFVTIFHQQEMQQDFGDLTADVQIILAGVSNQTSGLFVEEQSTSTA